MAINGIEIKVGQKWKRRNGEVVEIVRTDNAHPEYKIVCSQHATYRNNGLWSSGCAITPNDLVELVEDVPEVSSVATEPNLCSEAAQVASESKTSAPELLEAAAGHMRDRAATYDKPEGERSMAKTVAVFNQFHGTSLTEAQGWHFMQVLKDVRLFTNPAKPHVDSIEDGVAYCALKGEAMLKGGAQ